MTKFLLGGAALMVSGYMAWWSMSERPSCESGCGPVPTLSEADAPCCEPVEGPMWTGEEEAELIEVIDLSRAYEPAAVSVPADWHQPIGRPATGEEWERMPYLTDEEETESMGSRARSAILGGFAWCWENTRCDGCSKADKHCE